MAGTWTIRYVPETDSTNRLVKDEAGAGAPFWTAVVADSQTRGVGRLGRVFYSPPGTGLYLSVLLPPTDAPMRVTAIAAVATARAVEKAADVRARVKWVNDIFVDGRKVSGILAQGVWRDGALEGIVLGVGVNIAPPPGGFPQDIQHIAGALVDRVPDDWRAARDRLAEAVLEELQALLRTPDDPAILAEYRARCFIIGADVTVYDGNDAYPARVLGVEDDFALRVMTDAGERRLRAGEVSVRV